MVALFYISSLYTLCIPSCLHDLRFTPLHRAAMEGHMNIVKFLTVERHCDPMCRDIHGDTALHYAVIRGQIETVKFLTEKLKCPPDIPGQWNMTPSPKG